VEVLKSGRSDSIRRSVVSRWKKYHDIRAIISTSAPRGLPSVMKCFYHAALYRISLDTMRVVRTVRDTKQCRGPSGRQNSMMVPEGLSV
jgi:hypothetical protein